MKLLLLLLLWYRTKGEIAENTTKTDIFYTLIVGLILVILIV